MYSEISNAMEGFFTPVGEINAIVNASNTDTKLMTYLSLVEGLKSDPSTYKRSITIKESNMQYILVVNSSVDRMIADNTIFNGIPTKIFIYPESVTTDDGSNREVHKYIMDTIAIISKSFHDIFDFSIFQ